MWAVVTESGELVRESKDCLWPSLATDIKIRELRYRDARGQVGKVEGFDAYGFQRFSISPVLASKIR